MAGLQAAGGGPLVDDLRWAVVAAGPDGECAEFFPGEAGAVQVPAVRPHPDLVDTGHGGRDVSGVLAGSVGVRARALTVPVGVVTRAVTAALVSGMHCR